MHHPSILEGSVMFPQFLPVPYRGLGHRSASRLAQDPYNRLRVATQAHPGALPGEGVR